ncbi:lipoteichoic acid synthase [Paenibacillus sp. PvP094]|uniref:LTA synthase family protein n=1 Tax=Paenibacillus sp. PvP094 TaxID=3156394 RepID=UPI003393A3B1
MIISYSKGKLVYLSYFWFVISLNLKIIFFAHLTEIGLDLNGVLLSVAVSFLFSIVLFSIKGRNQRSAIWLLINFLISLILWGDLIYFRFFGDVLSVASLSYADQTGSLLSTVLMLTSWIDVFFFIDILVISPILFMGKSSFTIRNVKKISALLIVICSVIIGHKTMEVVLDKENVYGSAMYKPLIVQKLGIVNYHIYDIGKYLMKEINRTNLSDARLGEIQDWFVDNNQLTSDEFFGIANGKNVIMIQEESLQNFVINLKVNGEEITPNLNKLIQNSIYFSNVFNQTANGRTSDAELLALASMYPISEGAVSTKYQNNHFSTLPKILAQYGYSSFSAHPSVPNYWNRQNMHKSYGFEKSDFVDDYQVDDVVGWGLSDLSFFRQTSNKLDNLDEPFFSFLITLSNHTPYNTVPDEYKDIDLSEVENEVLRNYLYSAHYADIALGEFIEILKNRDLYDNTMLVIYGDHDSGIPQTVINELNLVEDNKTFLLNQIPLIFHIPDSIENGVIDNYAGEIDIAPTVLHLMGIDPENSFFMGRSIFSKNSNDSVAFRNGSYLTNELFYDVSKQTCFSIKTNQMVDGNLCENHEESIYKMMDLSDLVLEHDLIYGFSEYIKNFKTVNGLNYKEQDKVPEESIDLKWAVDQLGEDKKNIMVNGWALDFEKESSSNQIIYILLQSEANNKFYRYPTELVYRPDVTEYFNNNNNYDYSGFNLTIKKEELDRGKYSIGVIVKDNGEEKYVKTDKTFEIN